eukprot:scaffold11375_cov123-Isochrysis_galbana.AAC.1
MSNLQHEERCVSGRWAPLALAGLPRGAGMPRGRAQLQHEERGSAQQDARAGIETGADGSGGGGRKKFSPARHAAAVLAAADTDASGDISPRELRYMLAIHPATAWARAAVDTRQPRHARSVSPAEQVTMRAERTEAIANDIWSFQDVDRDGILTLAELLASAERWARSLRRSADAMRRRQEEEEE